jgi:hypothetical protein
MSIAMRGLLSISAFDYQLLNAAVRMYNPLAQSDYPACRVYKGIGFPFINDVGFGSKLPSTFMNDVKHQIKKDGSERVEVTSHLLLTDKDETLFYHLPFRKRMYQGNKSVGTEGGVKYNVPSNVHTVIQLINVFTREPGNVTDYYISKDITVTVFTNDHRFNDLKNK